jgi:hypothetical protein
MTAASAALFRARAVSGAAVFVSEPDDQRSG